MSLGFVVAGVKGGGGGIGLKRGIIGGKGVATHVWTVLAATKSLRGKLCISETNLIGFVVEPLHLYKYELHIIFIG